jgi:hypothetical protein
MGVFKEVLSRLSGRATVWRAAIQGDPGILATLEADHAEIDALMKTLLEDPAAPRRELLARLRVALLAHARAEAQEFYAVLGRYGYLHPQVVQSAREHDEIATLLGRLDDMDGAEPVWLPTLTRLVSAVDRHVGIEERELFDEARRLFTSEQLRDMDEQFRAAKRRYQDCLEGRAPGVVGHA